MPHQLDIYVTLRSPYSYLASARMREIASQIDIPVHLCPVYPIAIKTPDFFETSDPLWLPYFMRDVFRVADMMDMPLVWPDPDPIVQDIETRRIASEQPYIARLTRLVAAANEAGRGLDFYAHLSRLIFGGTAKWNEGRHLADAASRAGLELSVLQTAITDDPDKYEAIIAANGTAQRNAGHWGTPLFVFDGEPFFGQDRIDMCLWRMRQRGVKGA